LLTRDYAGVDLVAPDFEAWDERDLPLDREILLASTQLPGTVHGDPADRMLIAAAALSHLPLGTCDPLIVEYAAEQGGFSVCDLRE
jgi:PIN domain nuclease of toxin-antitoxin system